MLLHPHNDTVSSIIMVLVNKKINLFDLIVFLTLVFSISGYLYAKAEKTGLNHIIEGKEKIAIELLIPDVNSSSHLSKKEIFNVGDYTAITIRNRPYTKLKIIKSEFRPKLLIIPDFHGSFKTHPDPTRTNIKDYTVTLSDIAIKTNDGYVIGGNKIKIGNQIELEGFDYRLGGKVVNIYPIFTQ